MKDEDEYLISFVNLESKLFNNQNKFLSEDELENFYSDISLGFPICLPIGIKYFDYKKAKIYKINKKKFSIKIFRTKNINYIGNKKFFRYGNIFASNVFLKKKYYNKYKFYLKETQKLKKSISILKKNYKKICAMQIRNAPHFGHEAVFRHLLKKFDLVVLNPIFGIKKKNDFSDKIISLSLKFMEKKYKNIKFLPIVSNFHYAGPREAIHHMIMRENLGFDYFYVGRDHAGAENLYKFDESVREVIKYQYKYKIKYSTSKGGYYCSKCNKYLIKSSCMHKKLNNISGTEFRKFLKEKKNYKHADQNLQKIIKKHI